MADDHSGGIAAAYHVRTGSMALGGNLGFEPNPWGTRASAERE
jgi:hypothetical protein